MFWIVQSNLFREENYESMLEALKRLEVPHQIVKVLPLADQHLEPEPVIPTGSSIFVCGSTKLMRIAKERGWEPGSFMNANMRSEAWDAALGADLLNHGAIVGEFGSIEFPYDGEWFIRPCEDGKAFTGKTFYKYEFDRWRAHMLDSAGVVVNERFERVKQYGVKPDTPVAISKFRKIFREYRFFVVDRKIITGSMYTMGGKSVTDGNIDIDADLYVRRIVDLWQPSRAFVVDIAITADGPKVVEYNCINCSGFYACDTAKIVDAVEQMGY